MWSRNCHPSAERLPLILGTVFTCPTLSKRFSEPGNISDSVLRTPVWCSAGNWFRLSRSRWRTPRCLPSNWQSASWVPFRSCWIQSFSITVSSEKKCTRSRTRWRFWLSTRRSEPSDFWKNSIHHSLSCHANSTHWHLLWHWWMSLHYRRSSQCNLCFFGRVESNIFGSPSANFVIFDSKQ